MMDMTRDPRVKQETFPVRLARLREGAGLSQRALAKACGWQNEAGEGSQSRIGNYELGLREPTLSEIAALAAQLNVSGAYLAFGLESGQALDDQLAAVAMEYGLSAEAVRIALTAVSSEFPAKRRKGGGR